MKKIIRVLVIAMLSLVALASTGVLYQTIASARDSLRYPPAGQLVDIGGYHLHLYCMGHGSPTVVLNSASFDTVSDWIWLQPKIAQVTRVCAYDRAGLGWSDRGPGPVDPRTNARQLHLLLEKAGIHGPLVMVGHSFGGLYSRYFAAKYPEDVVGSVLIEATPPDFLRQSGKPEIMPNADEKMINAGPIAARLGILRLFHFVQPDRNLPLRQKAELSAFYSSNKFADSAQNTFHAFPSILAQVRSTRSLGSRPLVIVVGSKSENASGQLFELQQELAALSSDGVIRIVDGADHTSLVRSECDSVGTFAAIREVVEAVRKKMCLRDQK